MNNTQNEHGTMVIIKGHGVLLTGPSGIGKTELALSLIERGAALLSDDAVMLTKQNNQVVAARPTMIQRGIMHCRYLGVFSITDHWPQACLVDEHPLNLVIQLRTHNDLPADPNPIAPLITQKKYGSLTLPMTYCGLPRIHPAIIIETLVTRCMHSLTKDTST